MRVTFVACLSGSGVSTCPDTGNSSITQPNPDGQVLVAFRVPAGAKGPSTFATTAGVALTFTESASYAAELQRLLPAPGDQRWIGYVSQTATVPNASEATIAVDIELPPDNPFVGPFKARPVVGARSVTAGALAERPVACGADPYAVFPPAGPERTVCVDSPTLAVVGTDIYYATRDFGVQAGNATASPGQTVALPFNVRGAGAIPAGVSTTLNAGTSLPGVTVAPSATTVGLSNGSDTRVTVPVAIPADAAAGAYDVVLTGRLENGQERRGVAQLTVRARPVAPDVVKPVVSGQRVKPKAFKPASRRKPKRGAKVSYRLSEAASVRVVVARCSKYAKPKGKRRKAKRSLADAAARKGKRKAAAKSGRCLRFKAMRGARTKAGKAGANGFRFRGKWAGKRLKPGRYRFVLTPTDAAGNRGGAKRAPFTVLR